MLAHAFNEMAGGLEERTQALVAVNESRRQLLADVSHELMTPLAAIRGYVETMTMADLKLDEPTRQRYLGIVADETGRLEHIIGDLLDLARVEGGGAAWKRESVSVSGLFERVLHRHDPLLRTKHIDTRNERRRRRDDVHRRSESPRAGAAEPGGQRRSAHAGRRSRLAPRRTGRRWCAAGGRGQRRRGFRPNICRAFSIASTKWMSPARAPWCRPAAGSACPSFRPSFAATAGKSPPATPTPAGRDSRYSCPTPRNLEPDVQLRAPPVSSTS